MDDLRMTAAFTAPTFCMPRVRSGGNLLKFLHEPPLVTVLLVANSPFLKKKMFAITVKLLPPPPPVAGKQL